MAATKLYMAIMSFPNHQALLKETPWRIRPAGDRAALIGLPAAAGAAAAARVLRLREWLHLRGLPGIVETVPGFNTLLVYYDPLVLPYALLAREVGNWRDRPLAGDQTAPHAARPASPRLVRVPVLYGGEAGPDLGRVAELTGLCPEAIVAAHTGQEYTVFFLGFIPGFAYMGELPPQLAVPRRERPRPTVPAGAVGLAGRQTGIYPSESPGGWQIIGRTPLVVYDPHREPRSLLRPGDRVRFEAVTADLFMSILAGRAVWEATGKGLASGSDERGGGG